MHDGNTSTMLLQCIAAKDSVRFAPMPGPNCPCGDFMKCKGTALVAIAILHYKSFS